MNTLRACVPVIALVAMRQRTMSNIEHSEHGAAEQAQEIGDT